jgi:thermitase
VDNQRVYPCDYDLDNIICVAATDSDDQLAYFSDFGEISVDVGAPGVGINSATIDMTTKTNMYTNTFDGSL